MDTKLIAALACGAALALGACSGDGNTAAPATPGPTDPMDPADPAAPDDRTAAEKAFDTALDNAEKALADARALAAAAEARAAAARTDAARTAAQMDIDAARTALGRAVTAARALDAPSGDFDRIGAAAIQVDKAEAAEDEDEAKLRMAEGSTGWAGSSALVIGKEILRPAPALSAVRRPRRSDGADAATLLTAEKVPAVMHEDGKIVMADGLGSSGDRLRMRGIPIINAGGTQRALDNRRFLFYGPFIGPRPYLDPHGGGNNGVEPRLVAGLTITPSGLVVDMGGKGAPGIDLRLPSVWDGGRMVTPDESNGGYDLTLDFGRPSASPEGNAEHYWTAALMPSPEHLEAQSALFKDGERLVPVGAYTMRLSNHAGLDRNLEDPDAPPHTVDDENHYLSYAAYGHMEFRYSLGGATTMPSQRTFPFHVGYDAFKDDAGMKTTDIADADKIAKGKFKGRTMASQFGIIPTLGALGSWPRLTGAEYLRLRGDVELTATISGTAADNKISGKIMNLESWDAKGFWEDYAAIPGDLTLQESSIGAAGSFAGVVDTSSLAAFAEGGYKGNFYGPPASLEAAGIWYLQDGDNVNATAQNLSIVGSFGAALVREDGVWGVARRGGG